MWWSALVFSVVVVSCGATSCVEAQKRCAFRTGCGAALNNYMYLCKEVLSEPTNECPEQCEHALIALVSTEEGKDLMNCQCEHDEYCEDTKQKINVCRTQVLKGAANVSSSCRLSQLICLADAQCATALEYYHLFCKSVYRGRKCNKKCLNSIEILRRQEKAAALTACQCDNEDNDCPKMQNNLARLCFHKHLKNHTKNHERGPKQRHKKTHHQLPSEAERTVVSLTLITLCISSILKYCS